MKTPEEIIAFLNKEITDNPEVQLPYDFNVNDWAGGNMDDAYDLGVRHGSKIGINILAEKMLKFLE